MANIAPIGDGAVYPAPISYQPVTSADNDRVSPSAGALAASGTTGASPVARLQDALVDMLQSAGLDPQSQRVLELMIGLMILMALLESLRSGSGGGGGAADVLSALANGGRGGNGYGSFAGMTAIAFEQTTTTTVYLQSVEQYEGQISSSENVGGQDRLDTLA